MTLKIWRTWIKDKSGELYYEDNKFSFMATTEEATKKAIQLNKQMQQNPITEENKIWLQEEPRPEIVSPPREPTTGYITLAESH